jgi:hypothetical protein
MWSGGGTYRVVKLRLPLIAGVAALLGSMTCATNDGGARYACAVMS